MNRAAGFIPEHLRHGRSLRIGSDKGSTTFLGQHERLDVPLPVLRTDGAAGFVTLNHSPRFAVRAGHENFTTAFDGFTNGGNHLAGLVPDLEAGAAILIDFKDSARPPIIIVQVN